MKTILLLMCSLFLIPQISFGKEINTNASTGKKDIKLERVAFNSSSISKKAAIERNRVWLNFSNAEGAFKQALVGYVTGATNGWDKLYDAVTIDSNPYVDFYSINLGKNLTIQGRGLPFVITDEVPLGYKSTIVGTFNITIDHVDGLFLNQDIFLKDLVTGVTHNLKNGTYSFETLAGRFNDRFVLLYVNAPPVTPAPPIEPILEEPIVIVPEVPAPIVIVPEVPAPIVTDPIVTVPEVPAPIVTDPIVVVPEVPAPIVTDPIVTVPEVPAPIVTDPIVVVPEVPAPIVTDPIVTVPEVPAPIVTDPIVVVPEVPAPIVTDPIVTVPEVPAPIVTDPIVTVPEVPAPVVIEPIVTVPEVPAPVVTDPIVVVSEVPAPIVTEPIVVVPEVPAPIVTDPIVTVPEVPAPVVIEPIVTVPEIPVFIAEDTVKNYNGKGKSVIVLVDNNQITISSGDTEINEIYVYTLGHKQLFGRTNLNTNEYVIADIAVAKQVLIIKTQLKNGKWANSKIVL
nr:hypothetical protein [uncultured Flavobacterium sp.]